MLLFFCFISNRFSSEIPQTAFEIFLPLGDCHPVKNYHCSVCHKPEKIVTLLLIYSSFSADDMSPAWLRKQVVTSWMQQTTPVLLVCVPYSAEEVKVKTGSTC